MPAFNMPKVVIDEKPEFSMDLQVPEVNVVKWPAEPITTPGIHVAWPMKDEEYFDRIKPTLKLIVQQLAIRDVESGMSQTNMFMDLCYRNQVDLFKVDYLPLGVRDEMAIAGYSCPQMYQRTKIILPLTFTVLDEQAKHHRYFVQAFLYLERLFTFLHTLITRDDYAHYRDGEAQHILCEAVTRFLHDLEVRRIIYGAEVYVSSNAINIGVRPVNTSMPFRWSVPIVRVSDMGRLSIRINGIADRDQDVNKALVAVYPHLEQIVLFDKPDEMFESH